MAEEQQSSRGRGLFIPVTGEIEYDQYYESWASLSSGHEEIGDLTSYLKKLPPQEAEIFWLLNEKNKNQKDVATILGLSQPTVSYRYKRALEKLSYLMVLCSMNVPAIVRSLPFLKEYEQLILVDLCFSVNQDLVRKRHNVRQSTVKWIFLKSKRRVTEAERKDPETWMQSFVLLKLLERYLGVRVL